jgi:hypothetical protein
MIEVKRVTPKRWGVFLNGRQHGTGKMSYPKAKAYAVQLSEASPTRQEIQVSKNPAKASQVLKRGVWVSAKVMITKAGKVLAKDIRSLTSTRKRKPAKRKSAGRKTISPRRRNGNGYVVYPSSRGTSSLAKARKMAKEESMDGEIARVESVDTQKVVARYRYGRLI